MTASDMWFFLSLLIGLAVLAGLVLWLGKRLGQTHLPASSVARYRAAWASVQQIADPHRKIMEAEKIIDGALRELGYRGSFADKLKKAGPRFVDVQTLWNAHKLRNRIAHELQVSLDAREAERALRAFERALDDLT